MSNPALYLALRSGIALVLGTMLIPVTATAAPSLGHREGVLLVKPNAGLPSNKVDEELGKVEGKVRRRLRGLGVDVVDVPAGKELEIANRLNKNKHFAFAEPDMLVKPVAVVNDPGYASQWHLPLMGAPSAWAYANGKGITVAVCDTGVNAGHPDLAGQTVPGWNTASDSPDTSDVHGHGTMVSGVIAAAANNLVGGASVAPGARIMTMRITDRTDGYAYFSDMTECVTWAADHGARVANISFGGVPGSATVASAASYMMSNNGLVVVAAGNDGADKLYANSPYLFTAAATDSGDARATYSNFGAYVDIAAPGSGIYTTNSSGGYSSVSGTSFSSPNTAAVIALVMSANPTLTPTDVTSIITNTAKDLGSAGWDAYYGFGRVDALAATQMAAGVRTSDTTPPTVAVANPGTGATVQSVVAVDVQARDDFGIVNVDFLVDGTLIGTDTQEDPVVPYLYKFSWDSAKASNGDHRLKAVAKDAAGNVGSAQEVTVTVANATDTEPPVFTRVTPKSGEVVSGILTMSATATDNAGVPSVTVSGGGVSCTAAGTASCNLNLRKVAAGSTIVVSFTATDGRNTTSAQSSVVVGGTTTTKTLPNKK